ncbi:MAG TPA: electron transfer flavoprotein subunit alpha/FixB family protein [Baekduia sp.]|nr:electron transfer flavoprotein subunit alpha/FixB family protein [Baekduia sp.]
MSAIWVVLPVGVPTPSRVIAELLGEAKRLADDLRGEVAAAVIGSLEPDETPEALAGWGATRILRLRGGELDRFHPERFAAAAAAAIAAAEPVAVLFPGTMIGVDLGVRTSLLLHRRFMSGCVDFAIAGDHLRVTRPAAGGREHVTESVSKAPYLVSLIPDTVGAGPPETGRTPVVDDVACAPLAAVALRDGGFVPGDPATMDLVDAEVIVAGGRGLGSAEGFHAIEEVAELIGGSVGASRPAVEAGWAPYDRQIGQTGRTVTPKLYMACGISGASQHLAGMRDAQTIITINTDASAPINTVAKLAVVGDVQEVLAALVPMLRERAVKRAA